MEKDIPTPKNTRYYNDTIGKHQKRILGMVKNNDQPVTLGDIAEIIEADDDYFRLKRDEEEVRAMILADFEYSNINRFDSEWVRKYVKFLRHDDRVKLIKCFLDTFKIFVEKYRDNYPTFGDEERKKNMYEIINVLLIMFRVLELAEKACRDVKDGIAGDEINNSLVLKIVKNADMFYYERPGWFRYRLVQI